MCTYSTWVTRYIQHTHTHTHGDSHAHAHAPSPQGARAGKERRTSFWGMAVEGPKDHLAPPGIRIICNS